MDLHLHDLDQDRSTVDQDLLSGSTVYRDVDGLDRDVLLDDLDRDLVRNPDHTLDRHLDDLDRHPDHTLDRDLDDLDRDLDDLDRNPDHNLDRDRIM